MALQARMKRELQMLAQDPPHGVAAWPKNEESLSVIEARMKHLGLVAVVINAEIQGPEDTPYAKGVFKLEVTIPDRLL